MTPSNIHFVLSYQVRLDPQQSPEWIHEDQRLALVPALRHPSWDPKLRRHRRFKLSLFTTTHSCNSQWNTPAATMATEISQTRPHQSRSRRRISSFSVLRQKEELNCRCTGKHLFDGVFSFCLGFSVSSVHQGLPGNADRVFIWDLVSSSHMWPSDLFTSQDTGVHQSNFLFYWL